MEISYHALTTSEGNETFLFRFQSTESDDAHCLLVDAGRGTVVEDVLGPNDTLCGVLLTHAHRDHYEGLDSVDLSDASIFTAPDTAQIIDDVFEVAVTEGTSIGDSIQGAITAIDEWRSVAPSIDVRPVPAGHAPGACGFLIRFIEGDTDRHLLVTGDFTDRDAAGNPGMEKDPLINVEALLLTATTEDTFETELTDGLATTIESVNAGITTLVSASGLTGVQIVLLINAIRNRLDLSFRIRAVGQVAKILDTLDYGVDVELIPEFSNPAKLLDSGVVTVAGPEIPESGKSSGRLLEVIDDDPKAALVQFTSGGGIPVSGISCATHQFTLQNHPTKDTLIEYAQSYNPATVLISHVQGSESRSFNDVFEGYVWAVSDNQRYELFSDGKWRSPPWIPTGRPKSGETSLPPILGDSVDLIPNLDRRTEINLEAEGVDLDVIRSRLATGSLRPSNASTENTEPKSPRKVSPETVTPSSSSNDSTSSTATQSMSDQTPEDDTDEPDEKNKPNQLYNVVGPDLDTPSEVPDLKNPEPTNHIDARAQANLKQTAQSETTTETSTDSDGASSDVTESSTNMMSTSTQTEGEPAPESDDSVDESIDEDSTDESSTSQQATIQSNGDDEGGEQPDSSNQEASVSHTATTEESTQDSSSSSSSSEISGTVDLENTDTVSFDISPLVRVLVVSAVQRGDTDSVDEFVRTAVDALLGDALAGDLDKIESPVTTHEVSVEMDSIFEEFLNQVLGDESIMPADLLLEAVSARCDYDLSVQTIEVSDFADRQLLIERFLENTSIDFESVDAVVQAALERRLDVQ